MEIIFNQPKKLNAITEEALLCLLKQIKYWIPKNEFKLPIELKEYVKRMETNAIKSQPKVVLLNGIGNSFSAGADIVKMLKYQPLPGGVRIVGQSVNSEYLFIYLLNKIPQIRISLWNGSVIGGGAGISIHSPIRIATEKTLFSMPEVGIGLFPDASSTWFLPRHFNKNPHLALYTALSGHKFKGMDVVLSGLATHYMKDEDIPKLKAALAQTINANSTYESVKAVVDSFSKYIYTPDKFYFENEAFINKIFKFDSIKKIKSRLVEVVKLGENAKEVKLSKYLLGYFSKVSPISLIITFEQIRRGLQISTLEQVLDLESQLVYRFLDGHDLYEGIKANFVEKRDPNWEYKTIEEIDSDKLIDFYFDQRHEAHLSNYQFL